MKTWTAHTATGRPPVLVAEGFSWGALLFGPVWLAAEGAWLFAAIALALDVALAFFAPAWAMCVPAFLLGLFGQDLRRMSLDMRGYNLVHVIAASTFDGALARLLARRPDLIADAVA